ACVLPCYCVYRFYVAFFFFFSSRRRHTRCLSDWSSDVCSSDLDKRCRSCVATAGGRLISRPIIGCVIRTTTSRGTRRRTSICPRSEERRVGKECRSRWGRDH